MHFKVIRFKKQFLVDDKVFHEVGDLCLAFNQFEIFGYGSTDAFINSEAETYHGVAFGYSEFYENGYIEDTDLDATKLKSFPIIFNAALELLTAIEEELEKNKARAKQLEALKERFKESIPHA